MRDQELKERLKGALQTMQAADVPDFDAMWEKAQARYRSSRSRYQRFAGVAAVVAIAVTAFVTWTPNGDHVNGVYLTEEELMSSTQWLAPSDVLLPEHRFDIYGELPVLIETNDMDEGSRL